MAYTERGFLADYRSVDSAPKMPEQLAWLLYWNTLNEPKRIQIFGRHVYKRNGLIRAYIFVGRYTFRRSQLPGILTGIGHLEERSFAAQDAQKWPRGKIMFSHQAPSSILKVPGEQWSGTVNDTWVLAGVHSGQEFHAASPINTRNVLDKHYTMSVTGRELFGLGLAGYKELPSGVGKGTAYKSPHNHSNLSLVEYKRKISAITSSVAVVEELKGFGFTVPSTRA